MIRLEEITQSISEKWDESREIIRLNLARLMLNIKKFYYDHLTNGEHTGRLDLNQGDKEKEFLRYIGISESGKADKSIVLPGSIDTFTLKGYTKCYIKDKADNLTEDFYYQPVYELVGFPTDDFDFQTRYGFAPTGLVLWLDSKYPDNTVALWKDISGNSNDGIQGTPGNQPTISADSNYGNIYIFDGLDDFFDAGNDTSLNFQGTKLTINIWLNYNSIELRGLISKSALGNTRGVWTLGSATSGYGMFFRLNQSVTDGAGQVRTPGYIPPTNTWVMITAVYNGATQKIYVDTVEKGSQNYTNALSANTDNVNISTYYNTAGYNYPGKSAIIQIFSKDLSIGEMAALYNNDKSKFGII